MTQNCPSGVKLRPLQMQHPRVAFVPAHSMPYTAETFAKFNQQKMKSQNKTEHAVKLGKTVPDDTFNRLVRIINSFDTLADFYNDAEAGASAIKELVSVGVIPQAQIAELVDGDKLSAIGREILENLLIGKSFEGNANTVRMLTEVPSMRQSVIFALSEISNNLSLGDDFTLKKELTDAIKLCYEARVQAHAKFGEPVSIHAGQYNLFTSPEEMQTVADFKNATVMLLADTINDKRVSQLKKVIASYNGMAFDSANGQLDLFSGKVRSREDIIKDVLTLLNNGTNEQIEAAQKTAVERRKESASVTEAVPKNGNVGESDKADTGNERGRQGSVATNSASKKNTQVGQKVVGRIVSPLEMSDTEKKERGELLRNAQAINVDTEVIVSTPLLSARKAAELWWDEHVDGSLLYNTEVGEVEINRKSIESSLAHKYGQMKLDAITSLKEGFENAVYLGTLPDSRERGVVDHYFAYPINYEGKRCYVFCRALNDANKNRLYVHEVFLEDNIKKGNTLQTAASKPHGGIALYRDILANVLVNRGKEPPKPRNSSTGVVSNQNGKSDDTATRQSSDVSVNKDNKSAAEKQEVGEQSSVTNITIAPRTKGYTLEHRKDTRDNSDIYAVKFEERVSRDEFKGQKAIAKKFGGYWSNFGKKGFLFKNEEASQDFAETVMGRTVEEVEDEKPISIAEISPNSTQTSESSTAFNLHQESQQPASIEDLSEKSVKIDEKAMQKVLNAGVECSPHDFAIGLPPTQHRLSINLADYIDRNLKGIRDFYGNLNIGEGYMPKNEEMKFAVSRAIFDYEHHNISMNELVNRIDDATPDFYGKFAVNKDVSTNKYHVRTNAKLSEREEGLLKGLANVYLGSVYISDNVIFWFSDTAHEFAKVAEAFTEELKSDDPYHTYWSLKHIIFDIKFTNF